MTDDTFPAANIGFHQGTPVVPRRFLPTHAAMFGNRLQMPVTRSGRILGRLARHGTRTRWHLVARISWAERLGPGSVEDHYPFGERDSRVAGLGCSPPKPLR